MAQRMGNETCSLPSSPSVAQIISDRKLLLALGEHFSQVVYWPKRGFAHPQTYWQTKFHMSPSRLWCSSMVCEGEGWGCCLPASRAHNHSQQFHSNFLDLISLAFFYSYLKKWNALSHAKSRLSQRVWIKPNQVNYQPVVWWWHPENREVLHASRWVHGTVVFHRITEFLYWITPRLNLY